MHFCSFMTVARHRQPGPARAPARLPTRLRDHLPELRRDRSQTGCAEAKNDAIPAACPRIARREDRAEDRIDMAEVTIVYWRDIPAQIIVGKGRRALKQPLPERYEQAIDRCAMKIGARDSDAYLAEWRKAEPQEVPGEDAAAAESELARILAQYDAEKLRALIENDGWETAAE